MILSPSEIERYSRQMLITGWGIEGQEKLKKAKVAIVGIGGLGCLSSLYLAAAGIGKIILIDREKFELNNLNRQILCWVKDIGRPKAEVAKEKLLAFNPEIEIIAFNTEISKENIDKIIGKVDVIVDGLDNWKTRFMINEYCVSNKIPFVHAGVTEMHGQITTIVPGKGPCLRCIFPKTPREMRYFPIMGATPALLASLQVMETIKLITGIGQPLIGRILFMDGKEVNAEVIKIEKMANCPVCGESR